jgi:hypothetical protein
MYMGPLRGDTNKRLVIALFGPSMSQYAKDYLGIIPFLDF